MTSRLIEAQEQERSRLTSQLAKVLGSGVVSVTATAGNESGQRHCNSQIRQISLLTFSKSEL